MTTTIEAIFKPGCSNTVYTRTCYQWDRSVRLVITGLNLPPMYEVHFSNKDGGGISNAELAHGNTVYIPDVYFQTGEYVYAWIYLARTSDDYELDGSTAFRVIIPVEKRPAIYRALDGDLDLSASEAQVDVDNEQLIVSKKTLSRIFGEG